MSIGDIASAQPEQSGLSPVSADRYVGELAAGVPHGSGTLTYGEGDRFAGQFANGLPHGRGVLETAEGDRFEGEFRAGRRHGKGTLITAEGDRFEGVWRDGEAVALTRVGTAAAAPPGNPGKSQRVEPDPSRETVPLRVLLPPPPDDDSSGQAFDVQVARWSSPEIASLQARLNRLYYDAGAVDGKAGPRTRIAVRAYASDHGLSPARISGREFLAHLAGEHPATRAGFRTVGTGDCSVWTPIASARLRLTWYGRCEDGKASGTGTFVADFVVNGRSGSLRYVGSMSAGLMSGQGRLNWSGAIPPAGAAYVGSFIDGVPNGRGEHRFADGRRYVGEFRDGTFHGMGEYFSPGFGRVVGEFSAGVPNGFARHFDTAGVLRMQGNFRNGCLRKGREWVNVIASREECGF